MNASIESLSPLQTALPDSPQQVAFDTLASIVETTTELFGQVEIKTSRDPEFPRERYVVFVVEAEGHNGEILERESEWVRRVMQHVPQWNQFRLRIVRKP